MKGLRYKDLENQSNRLLSLTGLTQEEFERLLIPFSKAWHAYARCYTLEGKRRQRPVLRLRKNAALPTDEDKLLLILYYLKNNPLQEALAIQFGLTQPHVNSWLKRLRPVLKTALDLEKVLPLRTVEGLNKVLGNVDTVLLDATERPIQRSGDTEVQREDYSGKKKT
jgi:hypothetical protein